MIRQANNEAGYSMVELLMAILILSIAIIPMFTMFDSALKAADSSGDYDRARTFTNQRIEMAKNAPYDELRRYFPKSTLLAIPEDGTNNNSIELSNIDADGFEGTQDMNGPYPGLTYKVKKQFVDYSNPSASGASVIDESDDGDEGMIKVTITATWDTNKTYTVTGVVSR